MQQTSIAAHVATPAVLYSRYEDGARAVLEVDGGWLVGDTVHKTTMALLADLTGHPTGRHWSLDRYFSRGAYAKPKLIGQANVFDLFPLAQVESNIILDKPLAPSVVTLRTTTEITVPKKRVFSRKRPRNRSARKKSPENPVSHVVVAGAVGIDLVNRSHEVRKLFFAGFGRRIYAAGYDGDDVLQEVYRGLLARNRGKCPWDPSKSSFGHYVYMVCSCVLSNYHRKQKRRRQFEQIGISGYQADGDYGYGDVGSTTIEPAAPTLEHKTYLMDEAADDLVDYMLDHPRGDSKEAKLAVDVLPYVADGIHRRTIADTLNVSMAAISRAISFLRSQAVEWRASLAAPAFVPR